MVPKLKAGEKHGKLSLIQYEERDYYQSGRTTPSKYIVWHCLCDCGVYSTNREANMIVGRSLSCGCLLHDKYIGEHPVLTQEILQQEYILNNKNTCEIAQQYGYGASAVQSYLKRYNIPIRSKEEYQFSGYHEISKTYFSSLIKSAKERNLAFNVSIEDLWELFLKQSRKCALSGIILEFPAKGKIAKAKTNQTASLDRIDSNKGYELDNIQWVHKDINLMKMNLPQNQFINYCKQIAIWNGV